MHAERYEVTIVSDASGDGTGYAPVANGRVLTIRYVKTDYAAGVDFAITAETTGQNVWTQADVNASVTKAPRQATHSAAGAAATFDGTYPVNDFMYIDDERIKIVIANAGDTKSGTFYVTVG